MNSTKYSGKPIPLSAQSGMTLVELILYLGVFLLVIVLGAKQVHDYSEKVVSEQAGKQISAVADAMDVYIGRHYKQLMNLQSSPAPLFVGDYDSPRCRNCDANGCDISMLALTDERLIDNVANTNVYGAGYRMRIARRVLQPTGCGTTGADACYKLTGIVITDKPFFYNSAMGGAGRIRYDLLGTAVEIAGKHHGYTPPTSNTTIMGYHGSWSEGLADFPAIDQTGLLAARRGYESSADSEYLRRDGSLPMTGDLGMMHVDGAGNFYKHNILNANSVKATRFVLGDKLLPSLIFGTRDGKRNTYIQQGGELRVADADGNPGVIRAEDMFIGNRGGGNIALSDLLPTVSLRGSYWVKDGQSVPKPYCQNGANGVSGESAAKIILYPGIQHILTMSYNRRTRLAEANCPSDAMWTNWATDAGDRWFINVGSYATNNYAVAGSTDADGRTEMAVSTTPGGDDRNYMLAQTFCDYQGSQKSAPKAVSTAVWTQLANDHYQCSLGGFQINNSTHVTGVSSGTVMSLGNNSPKDICGQALLASATYGAGTKAANPLSCSKQSGGNWICKGRMEGFFKPVGCNVDPSGNISSLFGN